MIWSKKLSKNYALDISILRPIRSILDGLTGIEFEVNCDWFKADHCPKFNIILIICNFIIFEFEIYNVNHIK